MLDPISGLATKTIIDLAFNEFTKAASSQIAKNTIDMASSLISALRQKIENKFRGNNKAEAALEDIKKNLSEKELKKLEVYLEDEMSDDPNFARELQNLANQILQINRSSNTQTISEAIKYEGNIYGGKQVNIVQPMNGNNQSVHQHIGDINNNYTSRFSPPKYTFESLVSSIIRKHEYFEYVEPYDCKEIWRTLTDPARNNLIEVFEREILKIVVRFCCFHRNHCKDPESQIPMINENYYDMARQIAQSGNLNCSTVKLSSAIKDSEMAYIVASMER